MIECIWLVTSGCYFILNSKGVFRFLLDCIVSLPLSQLTYFSFACLCSHFHCSHSFSSAVWWMVWLITAGAECQQNQRDYPWVISRDHEGVQVLGDHLWQPPEILLQHWGATRQWTSLENWTPSVSVIISYWPSIKPLLKVSGHFLWPVGSIPSPCRMRTAYELCQDML